MTNRITIVFALALIPVGLTAQARRAALPFITLDGLVGYSSHGVRSSSAFYVTGGDPVARVAVAIRLGSRGDFRPVAMVDYFGTWGRGDDIAICKLAPDGSCYRRFPDVSGASLGLGVRRTLGGLLTVGVTGGVGRYRVATGFPPEHRTGFHADAEVALRFLKHIGVVVNIRHVEMEKAHDARFWIRPLTVGIRIQ